MLPDTIAISQATGAKPTSCSCGSCKNMCRTQICIGTPNDMLTIANNGFAPYFTGTIWAAAVMIGIRPVGMIQLRYDKARRCCSMLNEDGLCRLHALGIKPTEGVLSDMHQTNVHSGAKAVLQVAAEWINPKNIKTIRILEKLTDKLCQK